VSQQSLAKGTAPDGAQHSPSSHDSPVEHVAEVAHAIPWVVAQPPFAPQTLVQQSPGPSTAQASFTGMQSHLPAVQLWEQQSAGLSHASPAGAHEQTPLRHSHWQQSLSSMQGP
jgi:hypothetical protein